MALPKFKLSTHLPVLIGFFLTISIALTVVILQQQQETRSRAEGRICDFRLRNTELLESLEYRANCPEGEYCNFSSSSLCVNNFNYTCFTGRCKTLPPKDRTTACSNRGGVCSFSCRSTQVAVDGLCYGSVMGKCCLNSCGGR